MDEIQDPNVLDRMLSLLMQATASLKAVSPLRYIHVYYGTHRTHENITYSLYSHV